MVTMPVPALAQTPVAMVDCVVGGPCIGTSGRTITGSKQQDEIYGLEGDDTILSGNDFVRANVYCGPGLDTVDQMHSSVVPEALHDPQGALQYASEPDVIAEDCEERVL